LRQTEPPLTYLFFQNRDANNQLTLALNYSGSASNEFLIGGNVRVNGNVNATAYYYTSDISLKKDISPIDDSQQKIENLNGVYFKWKSSGEPSMGLIAQDVEKIFPEAVTTNSETGLKSVDYGKLVAPLIEAVKSQQVEIRELQNEISELRKANNK